MKKISYHLILLSFFICLSSCKETSSKEEHITTQKIEFKKEGELTIKRNDSILKKLDIEIANDDYQIQTGLMYRSSMATQQGMLFMFNDSDIRYFYMKNTLIPLDIIYINKNKEIVSIQKNAKPLDETTLPSEGPAMYVLEINGGLSDQWELQKGDSIIFNTL